MISLLWKYAKASSVAIARYVYHGNEYCTFQTLNNGKKALSYHKTVYILKVLEQRIEMELPQPTFTVIVQGIIVVKARVQEGWDHKALVR